MNIAMLSLFNYICRKVLNKHYRIKTSALKLQLIAGADEIKFDKQKIMQTEKNQSTGSIKGKVSIYLPDKRLWVYADTKKEADDYILRLRAKDTALQASRQSMIKKTM
jgi:hypothetical protein